MDHQHNGDTTLLSTNGRPIPWVEQMHIQNPKTLIGYLMGGSAGNRVDATLTLWQCQAQPPSTSLFWLRKASLVTLVRGKNMQAARGNGYFNQPIRGNCAPHEAATQLLRRYQGHPHDDSCSSIIIAMRRSDWKSWCERGRTPHLPDSPLR